MAEEITKSCSDKENPFHMQESEVKEMKDNICEYRDDSMICEEDNDARHLDDLMPAPLMSFPPERALDEDQNAIEDLHKGVMVLNPRNIRGKSYRMKTFLSGLEERKRNIEDQLPSQSSATAPVYKAHGNDGQTVILETMPTILTNEQGQKKSFKMKRKMPSFEMETEDQTDKQPISYIVKPESDPLKASPTMTTKVNISDADHNKSLQMSPKYESFETSQTHAVAEDYASPILGPSPSKRRRKMGEMKTIVRLSPLKWQQPMLQSESSSDTHYPPDSLSPENKLIELNDDEIEKELNRTALQRKISADSSSASEALSPDIPKDDDMSELLSHSEIKEAGETSIDPAQGTFSDNNSRLVQEFPSSSAQDDIQLHESPLDLSLPGSYSKGQSSFKITQQKDADPSDTRLAMQNVLPSTSEEANLLSTVDNAMESTEFSSAQVESVATGIEQMTLEQIPSPNSMSISESSVAEEEHASDVMKSEELNDV